MPLTELTAYQLAQQIKTRKISCREVTNEFLSRIEEVEPRVKAFVTVLPDEARRRADLLDKRLAGGEDIGLLGGVPVAVKDLICTRGIRTTCSSKMLENFVPPYDAHVAERLAVEGAVNIGKANMDEFAMGSSTENSAFFPTRNPWNLNCVPGGSSGGSTAAVAAQEAPLALGSDTGGSIRQPAAYCGCVGLKPTYGLVSRYGLIAFASSLDQIGPIANDVRDSALLLQAIAGYDRRDSTSINRAVPDYLASLTGDVKGLRIGVPKEFFVQGVESYVVDAVRAAIDKLCELGAEAVEVSMPSAEYALATYYIIAPSEASSNLARYDGVQYGLRVAEPGDDIIAMYSKTRAAGFGHEVQHRIMIGTHALSSGFYDAYYLKAQKVRTLIRRDFEKAFSQCDVLATPTAPTVAFEIGSKTNDPFSMKLADVCTIPVNMAGLPAISLPCGFQNNLPIGLQLIGNLLDESTLFRAAHAYEQATEWHKQRAVVEKS
ncbi:MAG: Asp-tRNA(Asn)/Glu-tRNA(Gln) amidotransferase subunit GatA [Abitibacteriaceae bacterium]|nr:Asp-tRNA(Asn)/Glu-tRNA(Gln) amidotransferase subunit GatA [Abditibacteriaceae bacterium]MBV9867660.1 Asp-tRNA(Asn)/Glu-tRNA(Gln) amidotransferase subunit GatA [Abditibacteriaceae bacterium]